MKHLSLLLVLAFYITAQSQNNQYNGTERWSCTAQAAYGGTCVQQHKYNEYFTGSVVDNGNLYYLVERNGYYDQVSFSPSPAPGCQGRTYYTSNCMMVRYDQKKIYTRSCQPGSTESVFLDFNLQVGDTIQNVGFALYTNPGQELIVNPIDSVVVNGSYLRRFHYATPTQTGPGSSGYVMDKIGSSYGFMENGRPFEYTGNLECFGTLANTYYSAGSNCDMTVGIHEQKEVLADLQLFPNPSAGNLSFRTSETNLKQLRVLNALGELVYELNNPHPEEALDLSFLSPGFYFLELETVAGKGLRKFVRE